MTKKLFILIGTRPNFIKVTRFKELAARKNIEVKIIHTGQHFDDNMATIFFDQFNLQPDYFLKVGGLSPIEQLAQIMLKLEKLFSEIGKPSYLMVPGDVNSTLAGAIAANKMGITLIHLESGLRSFDKKMPEEHNRIVADNLSDICLVTEPSGIANLANEKIAAEVHYVGNTMIDTLVHFESEIEGSSVLSNINLNKNDYILCTFHRPSNVDSINDLKRLVELLVALSELKSVVIPIHPRTKKMLVEFDLMKKLDSNKNIKISGPIGYFEFQHLIKYSLAVITDSGGIQEETTYRQVPCLTVRENTERPITIEIGTNTLVPFETSAILSYVNNIITKTYKHGNIPEFWDGKTTERILDLLDF